MKERDMIGTGKGHEKDGGARPQLTDEDRDYFQSDDGIIDVMRALSDRYRNFRRCPVKRCRRARRCQGPDMICQLREPSRTAPRADVADINARMRQIALRRLERLGVW
jgi:hypothetical protein